MDLSTNVQWNLSKIDYYGIHLSMNDDMQTAREYKKGYFEINNIHLYMVDKMTGKKLAEIQIAFDENLLFIGKFGKEKEWSEYLLEKHTINQYLADLNIPLIKEVMIENPDIMDFDYEINYPASENIQSFIRRNRYHIGLNVDISDDESEDTNRKILEEFAVSDLNPYL